MKPELSIKLLLTERAAQENIVTGVEVSGSTITVKLEPKVEKVYDRPDCQQPVKVERHDREVLTVQGLGIQGKALRYRVESIRLGYHNDAGQFTTFTVPIPGIRTDLLVTDEVVDKALLRALHKKKRPGEAIKSGQKHLIGRKSSYETKLATNRGSVQGV